MRTTLLKTLTILLVIAVIANSCKKKDSDPTPTPTPTQSFACKINGTAYSATTQGNFTESYGIVMVSLPFSSIIVELNVPNTTGTFTLGSGLNFGYVSMSGNTYNTSFAGGSGTIVVSEYTGTKISGTFHYIAKTQNGSSTVTVTEGTYTNIPSN